MPAKEKVTRKAVEQDAREYFNAFFNETEASYRKGRILIPVITSLVMIPSTILSIRYPQLWLYFLLALVLFIGITIPVALLLRRHKCKSFRLEDYEIKTVLLSSVTLEEYTSRYNNEYTMSREVKNYTLNFEGGKSWRVPDRCYFWRKEGRLCDLYIYENSHRGDVFTVVAHKETGEYVMVYSHKLFDCQSL